MINAKTSSETTVVTNFLLPSFSLAVAANLHICIIITIITPSKPPFEFSGRRGLVSLFLCYHLELKTDYILLEQTE